MDVDLNYSGKDICGSREKQASYSFLQNNHLLSPSCPKDPWRLFFLILLFYPSVIMDLK